MALLRLSSKQLIRFSPPIRVAPLHPVSCSEQTAREVVSCQLQSLKHRRLTDAVGVVQACNRRQGNTAMVQWCDVDRTPSTRGTLKTSGPAAASLQPPSGDRMIVISASRITYEKRPIRRRARSASSLELSELAYCL